MPLSTSYWRIDSVHEGLPLPDIRPGQRLEVASNSSTTLRGASLAPVTRTSHCSSPDRFPERRHSSVIALYVMDMRQGGAGLGEGKGGMALTTVVVCLFFNLQFTSKSPKALWRLTRDISIERKREHPIERYPTSHSESQVLTRIPSPSPRQ